MALARAARAQSAGAESQYWPTSRAAPAPPPSQIRSSTAHGPPVTPACLAVGVGRVRGVAVDVAAAVSSSRSALSVRRDSTSEYCVKLEK